MVPTTRRYFWANGSDSIGAGSVPHHFLDRVEENIAADKLELSVEQLDKLDDLTPAAGGHHNEAQMRMIGR